MMYREPWSKKHKRVTGGTPYSFSNSYVEPLTSTELIEFAKQRGDNALIDEFYHHSLAYTPNGGSADLKQEIANLYDENISAENILVFIGGQAAIQTAALAILEPNSHSIVFSPSYQSVQQAPIHAGSEVTIIPRKAENNWQIDPELVEASIQENTKYLVFNEPFNPAGSVMPRAVQQRLIALAEKHELYILSDEVYRLLEHNKQDRLPAMAESYAKGLSVCTLSKPWGACGVSIGWVAVQDLALKQKLVDVQYFGTACPSRASELQAIMTLRASEQILAEKLAIIHKNMSLLDQFFIQYEQFFEWVRPNAGAIGFVKFKGPFDSNELGNQLAEAGISIKPAYVFGDEHHDFAQYFRIGFGEKSMPVTLNAFIEFIESNKANW